MSEERFLVATSDWEARQLMKRIHQGRVPEYDKVLHKKKSQAVARIRERPFGRQELYSVFRVNFDKERISKVRS